MGMPTAMRGPIAAFAEHRPRCDRWPQTGTYAPLESAVQRLIPVLHRELPHLGVIFKVEVLSTYCIDVCSFDGKWGWSQVRADFPDVRKIERPKPRGAILRMPPGLVNSVINCRRAASISLSQTDKSRGSRARHLHCPCGSLARSDAIWPLSRSSRGKLSLGRLDRPLSLLRCAA